MHLGFVCGVCKGTIGNEVPGFLRLLPRFPLSRALKCQV